MPLTNEQRSKGGKVRASRLSPKEKAFAAEWVKHRNGTKAALATYETKSPASASVIAHHNLAKVKVREEIASLLSQNGIELNEIVGLHARNARQSKHLPTSQKAVEDFYDILGVKPNEKPTNSVQVAFIIEK